MPRLLALGLALVALSACDSNDPVDPADDPLVGTWTLVYQVSEQVVVVTVDQEVADFSLPVQSTVTVRGAETGAFDRLLGWGVLRDEFHFTLLNYDPDLRLPERPMTLEIEDNRFGEIVRVEVRRPEGSLYYAGVGSDQLTQTGYSYRIDDVEVQNGDQTAVVSGTMTLGTRDVPAGEVAVVRSNERGISDTYILSYKFDPDGSYTIREGVLIQSFEREGTWTREGDRLILRSGSGFEGTVSRSDFDILIEDDLLSLSVTQLDTCSGNCLGTTEVDLGLAPGTLESYGSRTLSQFSRGPRAAPRMARTTDLDATTLAQRDRLLVLPTPE